MASKRLRKLGGDAPEASLMFAKFSPDGTRVAYVRANDIYVERIDDGAITRLTTDGSDTTINGTSDWVYEEELGVRDGFRWSPDGTHIAYWQFDTTGVEIFSLINNTDTLYPVITGIPYPKAGTTNSAVRIGVVNVASRETRWMHTSGDSAGHLSGAPRMARCPRAVDPAAQSPAEPERSARRRCADRRSAPRVPRQLHHLGRGHERSPVDRRGPLVPMAERAERVAARLSRWPRWRPA